MHDCVYLLLVFIYSQFCCVQAAKLFCWLICVMSRRYLWWWHNGKSGTARAIKKEVFTSSIHNSSRMKRNNMKWMSWKSVKRAKSVISRKTRNSSATSYWILAWRFSSGFYMSHNILDWYHLSPTPWNNVSETISGAANARVSTAHTDHPRDDNNLLYYNSLNSSIHYSRYRLFMRNFVVVAYEQWSMGKK